MQNHIFMTEVELFAKSHFQLLPQHDETNQVILGSIFPFEAALTTLGTTNL